MDALFSLAEKHNLFVLDDAAHALPARYRGRMIGCPVKGGSVSIPQMTAFSFYATKNITTAEGGMLTIEPEQIELARLWSLHGMSRFISVTVMKALGTQRLPLLRVSNAT